MLDHEDRMCARYVPNQLLVRCECGWVRPQGADCLRLSRTLPKRELDPYEEAARQYAKSRIETALTSPP